MSKVAIKLKNKTKLLSIEEIKSRTDQRLNEIFTDKIVEAKSIDPAFKQLIIDMSEFIKRGGKRLRPYLVYIGYAAGGGKDDKAIIDVCAAIELFHNFVLIHDDVMDRDYRRYGGLNIAGLYQKRLRQNSSIDSQHLADSIAILSGDLNHQFTIEILANSSFSNDLVSLAIKRLNKMFFEVAAGQLIDVLSINHKTLKLKEILKISTYKTAGYSIESPLQIGAILAKSSGSLLNDFATYANNVGIAFQLTDDILGFFGDAKALGKPQITDLREGKKTVLMYYTLQFCEPSEKKYINSILGSPTATMQDYRKVKRIITRCGAHAKTLSLANEYVRSAQSNLQKVNLDDSVKEVLIKFANYCAQRKF